MYCTKNSKRTGIAKKMYIAVLLYIVYCVSNIVLWGNLMDVSIKVNAMQKQLTEAQTANENVLDVLYEIRDNQKQIDQKQKKVLEEHATNVSYIKNMGYNNYSDLSNVDMKLTTKDMNKIIDYWVFHMGVQSNFQGKGDIFIKASQETGLNPIYILAHAAIESAWGTSYIARTKHNYFGINCIDADPGQGFVMGDSIEEGIINGAKWIAKHYYNNGYTTLQSMKDANYATDPNWPYAISNIMDRSTNAL